MRSIVFLTIAIAFSLDAAEPLPLSASYWKDPSFLASFNGSYRINARIEPSVSGEERAVLVRVQAAMQEGKREAALQILKSSSLIKNSAALRYNQGNIEYELGRLDEAIVSYQSALERFPTFRRAHKNLGSALIQKGDLKNAEASLRKAVELGELDGSTLGLLGYCYLNAEQYASALQAYRIAQLTQPDTVEWKAGMAQCLAEVGDDQEALMLMEEVVESRPNEVSYALLLVNIQLHLEQKLEAIAGLELLRRQGHLDFDHSALLAQLYLNYEDIRMAKPIVDTLAKALDPAGVSSFLQIVSRVVTLGEWDYAMELLRCVESIDMREGNRSELQRIQAFILIQKEEEGAIALLEQVLKRDPLDGDALLMLAAEMARHQDFESAAMYYDRAAALIGSQYQALLEHGKMLVSQQRFPQALNKLREAAALQPSKELSKYIEGVESLKMAW